MKIESAVLSHIGKVRSNNEDNYYLSGVFCSNVAQAVRAETLSDSDEHYIFSVCDGIGGEDYGELASLSSVKALDILKEQRWSEQTLKLYIKNVVKEMKTNIPLVSARKSGAAIGILSIEKKYAYTANLGDCRIYLYRKRHLKQLTVDHTQAQYFIDIERLTPEEARHHPSWHTLTKCLCLGIEIVPEDFYFSMPVKIKKNDIFLLCSDGLTDMLSDNEIENCIYENQQRSVRQMTECLLYKALKAGGKDNVTCMLVKICAFYVSVWRHIKNTCYRRKI